MIHYLIGKVKNHTAKNRVELYIRNVVQEISINELLKIYRNLCQYKTTEYDEKLIFNYDGWKNIVCDKIDKVIKHNIVNDKEGKKLDLFYSNLIHFFKLRARNIEYTHEMPFAVITFIFGFITPLVLDDMDKLIAFIQSFWVLIILGFCIIFPACIFLFMYCHREYEMYEDLIDILEEMKKEASQSISKSA